MAENSKIGWGKHQTPGSVEPGADFQALQKDSCRRKHIHGAELCAKVHEIFCLILLGKSYIAAINHNF